jgi:hypothetical protein
MWWIRHTFLFSCIRSNRIAPELSTNASGLYCLVVKLKVAMVGAIWVIAIFSFREYGRWNKKSAS